MLNRIVCLILLTLLVRIGYTQIPISSSSLIAQGDFFRDQGDFPRALDFYRAAMVECHDSLSTPFDRIFSMVETFVDARKKIDATIDSLDAIADSTRKIATRIDSLNLEISRRSSEIAEVSSKIPKEMTKLDQTQKQFGRMIDSYGATGLKATLALEPTKLGRKWKYIYINEGGQKIDTLGAWDQATQFDKLGFARVSTGGREFLIDIKGQEYRLDRSGARWSGDAADFHSLNIAWLPQRIYGMPQLKVLIADNNQLRRIPKWIHVLNRVQQVNLASNKIGNMKNLMDCFSLKTLVLNDNDIKEIPASISNLRALVSLNLSENRLKYVPSELFQLRVLEDLDLEYNDIQNLGQGLGNMKRLKKIDLSFNHLRNIPQGLSLLSNLEHLGLTGNFLQDNKDGNVLMLIKHLSHLKTLRIGCNPLSDTAEERDKIIQFMQINLPNCEVRFN